MLYSSERQNFLSGKNRPILVGIRWQVRKAKLTQFIGGFSGEDGGLCGVGGDCDGVLVGRVARRVARVVAVVDGAGAGRRDAAATTVARRHGAVETCGVAAAIDKVGLQDARI